VIHLVIGAGGYAGRHAVTALREHVRVRTAEPGDDLAAAVRGAAVVHVAVPLRSPFARPGWRERRRPHPLLVEVAARAREAGVGRIVLLSSATACGLLPGGRVSERTRPRPESAHERALALDETWLRELGRPEAVVLRPAQPFGPGEPVLSRLVHALVAGRLSPPGGGRAPRTFVAGADLGRAFAAAGLRGGPGQAYLVGGVEGSWRELLTAAAAALSVRARLGRRGYDLAYLAAALRAPRARAARECWPTPPLVDLLARPQVVDDRWSRRELTWEPEVRTFEAGLAGLAEWFTASTPRVPPVVTPGTGAPSEI
jgi:nucleoside-diphosphate-sugar epimerase